MSKSLIAYFSRAGKNYSGGKIVNLQVGNTAVIAEKIHDFTGGTLFEIRTIKRYPDDYAETTKISRIELENNERPELSDKLNDFDDYEMIFLGYPNWWGTMPMAVFTFLESYDFYGKAIVPFCTHEGSGIGRSEKDIRTLCPSSNVLQGIAIRGSLVSASGEEVRKWLKGHRLI